MKYQKDRALVIGTYWFSIQGPLEMNQQWCVGLVVTEDPKTKERRGFIGAAVGHDQKADVQSILDWGSPVPPFFSVWLQNHLGKQ